jgi:single-stranded-DNA-specific exonuclease
MTLAELSKEAEQELLQFQPLTRRLLFNRGITTKKEAEEFLAPSYERDITDPFLMLRMTEAIDRIYRAIARKERVCIFADYDVDGATSSAVLVRFFRMIGV